MLNRRTLDASNRHPIRMLQFSVPPKRQGGTTTIEQNTVVFDLHLNTQIDGVLPNEKTRRQRPKERRVKPLVERE